MENISIIGLVLEADIVVKMVMLFLVLASIWSWTIIFDKYIKISNFMRKADKFERNFWSGKVLDDLYRQAKSSEPHPINSIFISGMKEWNIANDDALSEYSHESKGRLLDRIYQGMQISKNRATGSLEKGINVLAIIGASTPFIGLFGTVWGIMNSFLSIAEQQNTNLAVVAPGIAEALIATALGLFAAIPAVIFYNILLAKLHKYYDKLDDFISEYINLLSREIDKN